MITHLLSQGTILMDCCQKQDTTICFYDFWPKKGNLGGKVIVLRFISRWWGIMWLIGQNKALGSNESSGALWRVTMCSTSAGVQIIQNTPNTWIYPSISPKLRDARTTSADLRKVSNLRTKFPNMFIWRSVKDLIVKNLWKKIKF